MLFKGAMTTVPIFFHFFESSAFFSTLLLLSYLTPPTQACTIKSLTAVMNAVTYQLRHCGTLVEDSAQNPKIKCSNPATGTGMSKIANNYVTLSASQISPSLMFEGKAESLPFE